MKKVISVLLALIMIVGLLSTAAFAEEEKSDTFEFEQVKSKTSTNGNFELTSDSVYENGWGGGHVNHTLTIRAKNGQTITRIQAVIGDFSDDYGKVGVSGTAVKENSPSKNGDTVTVSGINASEFSFTGGNGWALFKDITVYYTGGSEIEEPVVEEEPVAEGPSGGKTDIIRFVNSPSATSENGNFELSLNNRNNVDSSGWYGGGWGKSITIRAKNNNLTITRIDAVVNRNGGNYGGVTVSKGTKQPNANVADGETVSVININDSVFSFTGDGFLYSKFKDITVYYTENATGSVLSQGNIWIVAGIAVVAAGTVAALVITKKKKSAAAETEEE